VILAIAQAFFDERLPLMGDETLFRRLEPLGEQANWRWKEPDAGLWSSAPRATAHLFGMMCWAAVDRLARIADRLGLTDRALYWRRSAEVIRTGVLSNAWNEERGYFASSFAGQDLDASLLLMPDIGFLPASDPRYVATLSAAERELRSAAISTGTVCPTISASRTRPLRPARSGWSMPWRGRSNRGSARHVLRNSVATEPARPAV